MDATYTDGVLTTRPLRFEGSRLCLNLHTAGSGSAKVAISDAARTPIPGFTEADCEVINADAVDFQVQWQNGADVSSLAGRPIRLQFTMRNTKLYAFQFLRGLPASSSGWLVRFHCQAKPAILYQHFACGKVSQFVQR